MTIASRAASKLAERRGADPTLPWGNSQPPTNGQLGSPIAGVNVSEKTVLSIAAAYSCLRVISDAVATLPLYTFVGEQEKRRSVAKPSVLVQPYAEITRVTWFSQATISLVGRGNVFGQIVERDSNLYPAQIKLVHPDNAQVRRLADGTPQYKYFGKTIPIDDVFHIPYLSVPGALVGLNPVEYLRYTFALAHAADLYGGAFFENSAFPSGLISAEGDLEEDEVLALQQDWNQQHQGIGQAHRIGVITGGADFHAISIAPEDAQFIESRQLSRAEIATLFGVPPHMIGDVDRTSSWGMGIEQQERMFNNTTLNGILQRFSEAFSSNEVTPNGQYAEFDLSDRYKGDMLTRFQSYVLGRNGGWLNSDEIRAFEGQAPIPDGAGQDYLQPLNMGVLGQVPDPMKPPTSGGEPQSPGGLDAPPK